MFTKFVLTISFIFSWASYAPPAGAPIVEPPVLRERWVTLAPAMLYDNGNPSSLAVVGLNLFPDARYIGIITSVEQSGNTTIWRGKIKNYPVSFIDIFKTGDTYLIQLAIPGESYMVYYFNGLYRIVELETQ